MKTTEARRPAAVTRAATAALAVGLVVAALGLLADGAPAAWGALIGTALSVGVFAFGALAVDAVARLLPAASLLFAMVTYTFQVVVMALAFVALSRSGLLDAEVSREWLGGAIIAGTLVWTAVHLRLSTTARIPAFETADDPTGKQSADRAAEPAATTPEGGAR
ncbi:hypothetical protein [Nocardioides sp. SYSU DS0651]|uniref:hypothetical protein n=1 Tax=Nocardioides sp. SYSU DS0651 TaxID=3415955 RepID=UPI003F4B38DC